MCLSSVLTLFCLFRAIQGPRIADRIVSINMICTLTMTTICIPGRHAGRGYHLVVIGAHHALLGFLAVVELCGGLHGRRPEGGARKEGREARSDAFDWFRFVLTAVLMLTGLFVLLVGVVSQYRFRYVLNRMHAASSGGFAGHASGAHRPVHFPERRLGHPEISADGAVPVADQPHRQPSDRAPGADHQRTS